MAAVAPAAAPALEGVMVNVAPAAEGGEIGAPRLDDPRVEEQAAYRAKMSRWKRDVSIAVTSDVFWETLISHRRASYALEHTLRSVQQVPPPGSGRLGRLRDRLPDMYAETEESFRDQRWAAAIMVDTPPEMQPRFLELQVQLTIHTCSAYWRRHVIPLTEWPPQPPISGMLSCSLRPCALRWQCSG